MTSHLERKNQTSIGSLISRWKGEAIILHYDHPTGATVVIAIHSTILGPGTGGTRMKPYPCLADAIQDSQRLAEGMTLKFSVAGLPYGGAKAVIYLPNGFDPVNRIALLHRYGVMVNRLNGYFRTGPDVGTTPTDMALIAERAPGLVHGLPATHGGSGSSGMSTAKGVFHGMRALLSYLEGDSSLKDKRVLVQGAGSVGGALIDLLLEAEAAVLFCDMDDMVVSNYKVKGAQPINTEVVYDTPCDIFAPCALGGILNVKTIPRLQCRAIAGGANNQLATVEDAKHLQVRGILYVPDFVLNIGGAIGILGQEVWNWPQKRIEVELAKVGQTVQRILELARRENVDTDTAARRLAMSNLGQSEA